MSGLNSSNRTILATFVVLATGFWGFVITFSDYPSGWSMVQWTIYIVAWHIPSAFVVGYLLPRSWFMGIAVCWGALLMLLSVPAVAAVFVAAAAAAAYAGRVADKLRHNPSPGG
jgi:hypothetical protein